MKCNGFWGLSDSPPRTYIIEFTKEKIEELLLQFAYPDDILSNIILDQKGLPSSKSFEDFGQEVWDILVAEYKRHNKGVDK